MSERTKINQGMNWIRKEKRLAIYLRDGLACVYCESSVEECERLTLDHLKPYSKNGNNQPRNLVTCCLKCNSIRGNRPWKSFCQDVATYLNAGIKPAAIITSIQATIKKSINVEEARAIIKRRGGFTAAMNRKGR